MFEEVKNEKGELSIRIWDDAVLSTVATPILSNEFGYELQEFGELMIRFMQSTDTGVGMAANQIGLARRIFVMSYPDHKDLAPIVVCNPVIRTFGDMVPYREGCLSLPGVYEQVFRPQRIEMDFTTPLGVDKCALLDNVNARVAQHEVDHLDGKMFFDRMTRQMRKGVLRQWEEKH